MNHEAKTLPDNSKTFFGVLKYIDKKTSLARALQLYSLEEVQKKCIGNIIDFGAKCPNNNIHQVLKIDEDQLVLTDMVKKNDTCDKIKIINLEEVTKLDESYDTALLANVIEHVFNTKNCLKTIYMNLNTDGELIGVSPFLYKFHADPMDFHRPTHQGLERHLSEAGFKEIEVTALGLGIFTSNVGNVLLNVIPFTFLRKLFFIILSSLDLVVNKGLNSDKFKYLYPLGYLFTAKK